MAEPFQRGRVWPRCRSGPLAGALLLMVVGCQSANPSHSLRHELVARLHRACVEHHGGLRTGTVDAFGSDLNRRCFRWAYRESRRRLP